MEGQVQVPVVSATADEPSCSFSASPETPRQGLGRTFPSPLRPRPGSSRILVASASTIPLVGCPIHLMRPNAPATLATTGRVQQQERWDNSQISFLPSPTDGAGVTVPCGHMLHTFPPEPGTTLTTETPASYTGHLRGLGKAGLGTISYSTRQASALRQVKNPQGMVRLLQWRPY